MVCLSPEALEKRFCEYSTRHTSCPCRYWSKRTHAYSQDAQTLQQGFSVPGLSFPCPPPRLWPYCSLGLLRLPGKSESSQQTPKAEINAAEREQVGGAKKNHRLRSTPKDWKAECGLYSCFFSWMIFMCMNHVPDVHRTSRFISLGNQDVLCSLLPSGSTSECIMKQLGPTQQGKLRINWLDSKCSPQGQVLWRPRA